ncbi:response regulator [Pseudoalteromonas sp. SCSIO 43201]|uniref:response regulator transcription factor n=1 Tax=Pseudoalteromonas TaxID=53246 RepID=UPI00207564FA|nr:MULTISPECIES: response regulator [Pseudoalteromonas]MDW7551372.1 response regulator [Pseudoalteromonas peptidolytica]USD30855.1 response regulator [Pseudoalteromonas sp. SCSIO 43201]
MKLLLVEDDVPYAQTLVRRLEKHGLTVQHVTTIDEMLTAVDSCSFDYFLLDMKLDKANSVNFIATIKQHHPCSKVVLLTGYASIATAVEAIKLGADDYLTKPASTSLILQTLLGEKTDNLEAEIMSPERLEWEHIQQVLKANDGNISQTARQLNMHRRTLQRKLQKKPAYK